jgi:hypothetical protein
VSLWREVARVTPRARRDLVPLDSAFGVGETTLGKRPHLPRWGRFVARPMHERLPCMDALANRYPEAQRLDIGGPGARGVEPPGPRHALQVLRMRAL